MKGRKTYTVSPHPYFVDIAWDENGKAIASRIEDMPERTFESLRQANAYVRECKAKGFHGVRINDRTGYGTFF